LPLELREEIYAIVLVVPEHERWQPDPDAPETDSDRYVSDTDSARYISDTDSVDSDLHDSLHTDSLHNDSPDRDSPDRDSPDNDPLDTDSPDANSLKADSTDAPRIRQRKIGLSPGRRDGELELLENPPLLRVCHQIRAEADRVYWTQNEWQVNLEAKQDVNELKDYVEPNLRTPMQQMLRWVQKIGGISRLKHLRDLTLRLGLCGIFDDMSWKTQYLELRVTFTGTGEMNVHRPSQLWLPYLDPDEAVAMPIQPDAINWHLANTNWRRAQNGWNGEGIIDYFLGDVGLWESWFCIFPDKEKLALVRDWSCSDNGDAWEDYYERQAAAAEGY